MTTRYSSQFHAAQRSPGRFRSSKAVSIVLVAAAAIVWAWWFSTDVRFGSTPWWGHAIFWFLIAGLPFLIGLAIKPWLSALVAPAGIVSGVVVAIMITSADEVFPGEIHPMILMFVWSMMMLAPWAVGHVIRGAVTAPRKIPRDY